MSTALQKNYAGTPARLFARYALPQMVGLLFSSVYLIVDGIFIGNRLGRDAMAAAAVSVPFMEVLIALAIAVSSGAGIRISGKLAVAKQQEARQTFCLSVVLTLVLGAVIMLLGSVFIDPLARLLGSTPEIHADATAYLRYIVFFTPFQLLSFLFGGLARNDGKPRLAMFALAFGSVSNIVLDYVFMYPLQMGIAGAALATALGPIFSVLILLPHFIGKKGSLYFTKFSARLADCKRIFVLGFPSFIMEFTIGIITFLYNFAIVQNGYGELGLAAYLMIGYVMLLILSVFLGFAEGLQPVFSYFAGAGEQQKSRALLRFSIKIFLLAGAICYGLLALFSQKIFLIFAPGDPELVAFTSERSLVYFSGFILAGFNILLISFWQSTKKTKKAVSVSLLRSLLIPPVLLSILPGFFGASVIWGCHSLSEVLTAGFTLFLLLRTARQDKTITPQRVKNATR